MQVGLYFLFLCCPFSFLVQYVREYQNYPVKSTMELPDCVHSHISVHDIINPPNCGCFQVFFVNHEGYN